MYIERKTAVATWGIWQKIKTKIWIKTGKKVVLGLITIYLSLYRKGFIQINLDPIIYARF
jgi:hypothetical protein